MKSLLLATFSVLFAIYAAWSVIEIVNRDRDYPYIAQQPLAKKVQQRWKQEEQRK